SGLLSRAVSDPSPAVSPHRPRVCAGALALVAVLYVVDLLRGLQGPVWRPLSWMVGLAAVVLAVGGLRRMGTPWRKLAPTVVLLLCFVPTYVDHTRNLEDSDGMHYYA